MDAKCLLLLLLLLLFCNSCCHSHRPDVSDLATWTSFDWHNCDGFLRVAIGRDPRLGSQLSRKKMPSIKSSIQVVVFSFHFPFCFLVFFGLFCFCFFFFCYRVFGYRVFFPQFHCQGQRQQQRTGKLGASTDRVLFFGFFFFKSSAFVTRRTTESDNGA